MSGMNPTLIFQKKKFKGKMPDISHLKKSNYVRKGWFLYYYQHVFNLQPGQLADEKK